MCAPNADVAVQFDVALMRPAQQGFFDVAVNFNDVFCSAKFDCCDDANASDSNNDADGVVDGVVAAGAVYPYVSWDVPLGSCVEEPLSFGATGAVRTRYTETTGGATPFAYAFAVGLPPAPVCASPCLNGGSCTGPNLCTCASGWTGAHCEAVSSGPSCLALYQSGVTVSGPYTLNPAGDAPFTAYCDMQTASGGWTLVGKFSNQDTKQWIDARTRWTGAGTFGDTTNLDAGADAKSAAWSAVSGSELMFTDTYEPGVYMRTTDNCVEGGTLSAFSKHLAVLRAVGIIDDRRAGTTVYYRLLTPCILNVLSCVSRVLAGHNA